jgi:hypothetical protein
MPKIVYVNVTICTKYNVKENKKNPPLFLHKDGKNCYEKEITC